VIKLFTKPAVCLLLIAIIGIVVYYNTFNYPFCFDDKPNIVFNKTLTDLNNFYSPKGLRYVGFLTFAFNYYLGGLNTFGYHIFNLFIHILNAFLVYYFVLLTFRTQFYSDRNNKSRTEYDYSNYVSAVFASLLFISHPVQTQAVTYIVQRFTSLAAFFYLLAMVMYIKARLGYQINMIQKQNSEENQKFKYVTYYLLSITSAVLAMKTKEIAFTLPFMIIFYEYSFFNRSFSPDTLKHNIQRCLFQAPFLLTLLIIPLNIIEADKPIGDIIGELRDKSQETDEISRTSYLITQFRVIITYVRLMIVPVKQNLDYDYPVYHSLLNLEVLLSLLSIFVVISIAAYLFYRSRNTNNIFRLTAFGIFWFFATLSVESSIIPIRDVINEHRLYLPGIGLIIAFATAFLYSFRFMLEKMKFPLQIKYPLMAVMIVFLASASHQRNSVWKNEINLWEDTVQKSPGKARVYINLGVAYGEAGMHDKAIKNYMRALELDSKYKLLVHYNTGNEYYAKGYYDDAIKYYRIALDIDPYFAPAHSNLGSAYYKKRLLDDAIKEYQAALLLKPDSDVQKNLLTMYSIKEELDRRKKEAKQ